MKSASEILADTSWWDNLGLEQKREAELAFCLDFAVGDAYDVMVKNRSFSPNIGRLISLAKEFRLLRAAQNIGLLKLTTDEARTLIFEYLDRYLSVFGGKIRQIISGEAGWPFVKKGDVIVILQYEDGTAHAAFIPINDQYSENMKVSGRIITRNEIWPNRERMDVIEVEWETMQMNNDLEH